MEETVKVATSSTETVSKWRHHGSFFTPEEYDEMMSEENGLYEFLAESLESDESNGIPIEDVFEKLREMVRNARIQNNC